MRATDLSGRPQPRSSRRALSVSTLVLPDPAGAMTRAAPVGSPTAASWSAASGTPAGSLGPSGRSAPCSSDTRWTTATPSRPDSEASSGPPSQTAGAPPPLGRVTSPAAPGDGSAPSVPAISAHRHRGAEAESRPSTALAQTAWCSRSPTRSRSTGHSHGWRPVITSAGGDAGSSSPIPGDSSITSERRSRHAAPSSSATAAETAATFTRGHDDHSPGGAWPGATTTERPREIGSCTARL